MPGKINKTLVDRETKGDKERVVFDTELKGFGLKITPAGQKSYIFQYRLGGRAGRTRRVNIGIHGDSKMTAEKARAEAERLRGLARAGIDPFEQKKAAIEARIPKPEPKVDTVESVVA